MKSERVVSNIDFIEEIHLSMYERLLSHGNHGNREGMRGGREGMRAGKERVNDNGIGLSKRQVILMGKLFASHMKICKIMIK